MTTIPVTMLSEDECLPTPGGGIGALATERGNLPLDAVELRASVTGLTAAVELEQGFRNPFDVPLEATYVFPLPDRAAVTALRMEAGDRVIEGVLKERGQARADYDAAIAHGQRAAIAEEERPDVFTMRVGNILPGERVTVRLTLAQPLAYEDATATFRFPLVVAPRYIPGSPIDGEATGSGIVPDTDVVPDASRIRPPVLLPGFPNPVRFGAVIGVDPGGLALTGIRSSLHAVSEESGPDGRTTLRVQPGERLDRDLIVRLVLGTGDRADASLVLVPDEGAGPAEAGVEGTFTFSVLPPVGAVASRPRDVVLVLDRSGSMDGWKMVAARRAAARIVDTLTGADRFAVFSFDTVVERPDGLGDGLEPATDHNRFRAVEHLARVEARGGTEMLGPLEQAVALLGDPGRDRVLVLVTDGQVGNEDQILQRLGPRLGGVRVHAVGIDRAVNAGFLGRLAAAGRGRCELVESEDRLDEAMDHIHRRIGAPLVTGLELAAEGLEMITDTVTPARLSALFPGVPLIITGRWRGAPAGRLVLKGSAAGQAWQVGADGRLTDGQVHSSIWARSYLRDLEDRYLASALGEETDQLERQITATSLRFGVLCRFTAFIAADVRVVAEGGTPHRVIQPIELPEGWTPGSSGLVGQALSFAPVAMSMPTAPQPAAPVPMAMGTSPGRAAGPVTAAFRSVVPPPFAAGTGGGSAGLPPASAGDAGEHPDLVQARRQAGEEAELLRTVGQAQEDERVQLLADLGSRLEALVAHLGTCGLSRAQGLSELRELIAELRACDGPSTPRGSDLAALWQRTLSGLTAFAEPALDGTKRRPELPHAVRGRRSVRRAFWRRGS